MWEYFGKMYLFLREYVLLFQELDEISQKFEEVLFQEYLEKITFEISAKIPVPVSSIVI